MGNGGPGRRGGGGAMNIDSGNGAQMTCKRCKKQGHKAVNCPEKKSNTSSAPTNTCGFCKKDNHRTEECFKNPKSPKYRGPPKVTVTNLNGDSTTVGINDSAERKQSRNKGHQPQYSGYLPQYYIPAYQGPQLWCPSCNSNDHAGDSCPLSRVHLSHSKMVCLNCGLRGHTEADCRHPDPVNCTICHEPGHKAAFCPSVKSELCKDSRILDGKDMRFKWNDTAYFQIKKTLAQEKQIWLEKEIAKVQHQDLYAGPMDIVDDAAIDQEYQNIAEDSLIKWKGQMEFIPVATLHGKSMPTATQSRSFRVTKSQTPSRFKNSRFSSASTAATAGSINGIGVPNVQGWLPQVDRTPPQDNPFTTPAPSPISGILQTIPQQPGNPYQSPLDIVTTTALATRMVAEKETAIQKNVRAHINKSYRSYHSQNYNLRIRQLGTTILELQVLSDRKLHEVKMAMAVGVNFWRDPRAMDALVHRRQALCNKCGCEGVIHDGRMRAVPVENAWVEGGRNVLEIEDFVDWGLFVVFQCACCNDGYDWKQRPAIVSDESVPSFASVGLFVNRSSSTLGSGGSL